MSSREKIVKKIYRETTINRVNKKIKLLGVTNKISANKMLNNRLLFSLIIFIISIITSKYGYFIGPILAMSFWFISEYIFLDLPIIKRADRLDNQAVFFFEVLALSLASGSNIKAALESTIKNVNSELSLEFKKTLDEMEMGKSFQTAISNMKERIPSDTINNVIININQASIFGNDIVNTLYSQIDYLRSKRILKTQAIINKLPMKISIISVLVFVPLVLLIILSPIIINLLT